MDWMRVWFLVTLAYLAVGIVSAGLWFAWAMRLFLRSVRLTEDGKDYVVDREVVDDVIWRVVWTPFIFFSWPWPLVDLIRLVCAKRQEK